MNNVQRISFLGVCEQVRLSVVHSVHAVIETIKKIAQKIWQAYSEPSRAVPPVVCPAHPVQNTYPKVKSRPWPKFLDNALGAPGANSQDITNNVEPKEKVTSLHAAALGDNVDAIYRLLAEEAEVDALDIRGQSPLYWAAYKGNLNAVTTLQSFGADLKRQDFRGKSPLRAAVKYGHEAVVRHLVLAQVPLNECDGRGLTVLQLAAYRGNFSMYKQLVLLGADPTPLDPAGRTAEDTLYEKYAENYHKRWFLGRLFSSRTPPPIPFGEDELQRLAARRAIV